MSSIRQHAEWLSLIEVSGPFVTMPVLLDIFPQGLEKEDDEVEVRRTLRMAFDEWADNQAGTRPDPAIHHAWVEFVLTTVLMMPRNLLLAGQMLPPGLRAVVAEQGETLQPDLALVAPESTAPRLLITLVPAGQDLEKPLAGHRWAISPATRMMELLRRTGVRLGLLTNGERWMLVDAPLNETTGFVTWDAALWLEEPLTLRAFRSLLGVRRFFGVPDNETLEAMLAESAKNQQEVTDRLGYQVREAVELLVRALDFIDKEQGRTLLTAVPETVIYEAALTVMMRLVFLLSAEERSLLRLGELLYDRYYAVSTLQASLREQADQTGEEVLERRHDAWARLLAIFRVVYGGVEHQDLRLPAYGGHLFDPDRYPFLEGRAATTSWRDTPARPLAINNRTVLHLLEALQFLQVRLPGGGPSERRRLSFRALDVEQIGHVYEGLLDHTVRRAPSPVLSIMGAKGSEVELALTDLEVRAVSDEQEFLNFLREQSGRDTDVLRRALTNSPIPKRFGRSDLYTACDGDTDLLERVLPFAGLLRTDSFEKPVVITAGSLYVTQGSDRRSTGTHYTPRSLTEPIVRHALDPLVYLGPAEGLPEEQWQLRPAADLLNLKVCDFAMGSGAFLVQSCRYLAEKLLEAWEIAGQQQEPPHSAPEGMSATGEWHEALLPKDMEERLTFAMRLVSERCLYGVDKNPMAVEMAKLSLWLITLAKNKPFTFLDHALRSGDSLLGASLRQIKQWSMEEQAQTHQMSFIELDLRKAVERAFALRERIRTLPERDVQDTEHKARLLTEAQEAMALVRLGADLLVATALLEPKRRDAIQQTLHHDYELLVSSYEDARTQHFSAAGHAPAHASLQALRKAVDTLLNGRRPFHWPLEFPEVFSDTLPNPGFSAIVSNPPFQGGKKITGAIGTDYRDYLLEYLANGKRGNADLCAYFFLRATSLIQQDGMAAMLATNTIAQGDTREVGLDQIVANGWTIPRAIPSRKWPGEASLEVAHVWLRNGIWQSSYTLDASEVVGITPFLTTLNKTTGNPYRLVANANKSFQGSVVLGLGFVLTPEEAQQLIEKDPRNIDVLFPYLNGEDLNSRPDQSPSRWVINFHDWPLERAEQYPDCMRIVREKVKPQRALSNRKLYKEKWWQFAEKCPGLYSTIAGMERVLVRAQVSKTWGWIFIPPKMVYDQRLVVFAFSNIRPFTILQGTFHWEWAIQYGATLRLDMSYTPTTSFETFPFPANMDGLEDIGERYYQHRQAIMQARQEGLTKTYNHFHDEQEMAEDIVRLRELHREMDEAVARAYGWHDLALEHGFHETKQGLRYTISERARREVLDRLLLLNHQRHAEEVEQGLHETGKKTSKGGKRQAKAKSSTSQVTQHMTLFD